MVVRRQLKELSTLPVDEQQVPKVNVN